MLAARRRSNDSHNHPEAVRLNITLPPTHTPHTHTHTVVFWGGWSTHSFIAVMTVSFSCYYCHCRLGRIPLLCREDGSRLSLVPACVRRITNKQACNWITHSSHSALSAFKLPLLLVQPDLAPCPIFCLSHELLSSVGPVMILCSCCPSSSRSPVSRPQWLKSSWSGVKFDSS